MAAHGTISLFELLYEGKLEALQQELLSRPSELHLLDRNGESLLHLAIRRTDVAAVRLLLAAGFDINTRSAGNWTVMEEAMAVAQAAALPQGQGTAVTVLREIHHATQADEHCRWAARREVVLGALRSMPDFSTVLAWRVGSYMIGLSTLLRRFLPSDTYRIRKKGVRVRVDSTLAGLDYGTLSWHRGVLSLLIRFDAGPGEPEILMLDHQRRRLAEYLRTWAYLKPDHTLDRAATARLVETGLQRETADQAECALTRHPADRSTSRRGFGRASRASASPNESGADSRGEAGGRDSGGGGGVGGSGVRFVSELVPLVPELDLWGNPTADPDTPHGVTASARYHCRCTLNVRLRERDGMPARQPSLSAHMDALAASEDASATHQHADVPSDAGDLALLQQLARGGRVLGFFTRPASARVSCAWGLPLSLEQFCVVMRLLAPINRHISGVTDYLVGMVPDRAFPTRLSVPLPISFFVEAALRSYSADTAHPHTDHFAFDDSEAHSAAARADPHFRTAPPAGSSPARCSSGEGNGAAAAGAAERPAIGSAPGANGGTIPPPPATSASLPERQASWRAREAERAHDSGAEEVAGAGQPAEVGASALAGPCPSAPADTLFEPPPRYEVVGEDAFLDELLDAFLSSIAVDGQHELDGGSGRSPSVARAHLD